MPNIGSLLKLIDGDAAGLHTLTDEELAAVQRTLVGMLKDLSAVCDEHGISWCLCGGAALGCVRHKGFIPWDDDLDIFMTRANYEKFKSIFPETLSEGYELRDQGEDGNLFHYPRYYKKGTKARVLQSDERGGNSLFIDIFLLENAYDGRVRRYMHGIRCSWLLFVDSDMRLARCRDILLKYGGDNEQLVKELKRRMRFARFFRFRSFEEWLRRSDRCFSKVKNDASRYVVCPSGALHYFGEIYERAKMNDLIKMPFEDTEFYIMRDYDAYLRQRYGDDYMTPPPEGGRERHHFIEFDLGEEEP